MHSWGVTIMAIGFKFQLFDDNKMSSDPDDRRKCVECTTWMTWNCDELRPEDPGGTAVPALHKFVPAQQLRESSPHKNLKENGKN